MKKYQLKNTHTHYCRKLLFQLSLTAQQTPQNLVAETNIHFICSTFYKQGWAWLAPSTGGWLWATQYGGLDLLPPDGSSPECPPQNCWKLPTPYGLKPHTGSWSSLQRPAGHKCCRAKTRRGTREGASLGATDRRTRTKGTRSANSRERLQDQPRL